MNFGQKCVQHFVNTGSSTIRSILIRVQVCYLVT
jgi:YiiL_rotase: L-rhamnose 1-epimerase